MYSQLYSGSPEFRKLGCLLGRYKYSHYWAVYFLRYALFLWDLRAYRSSSGSYHRHPDRTACLLREALQARAIPSRPIFVSRRYHLVLVDPLHFDRLHPPSSESRRHPDIELRHCRCGHSRHLCAWFLAHQCAQVVHWARQADYMWVKTNTSVFSLSELMSRRSGDERRYNGLGESEEDGNGPGV